MSQGALAVISDYNLQPTTKHSSWSQFTRAFSAANILNSIPLGKYLEIADKKFNGDSLILFRRTDFDKLNMLSSRAAKASRYLIQIDRMTTTFTDSQDPKNVIQLIQEEARMGIEYTVQKSTTSAADYFRSTLVGDESDYADLPLPSKKKSK
jgi:hypothetical protein